MSAILLDVRGREMNHTDFQRSVIEILRGAPNGLTAMEIAQCLGTTAGRINSRLSKLAAYVY